MPTYMPYLLGALGGIGILSAWYGLKAVRREAASPAGRRVGLVLVSVGVVMLAVSLTLIARGK